MFLALFRVKSGKNQNYFNVYFIKKIVNKWKLLINIKGYQFVTCTRWIMQFTQKVRYKDRWASCRPSSLSIICKSFLLFSECILSSWHAFQALGSCASRVQWPVLACICPSTPSAWPLRLQTEMMCIVNIYFYFKVYYMKLHSIL